MFRGEKLRIIGIWSSAWGRTGSTFVYTLFVRSGEECCDNSYVTAVDILKRIILLIHFFLSGYLIRFQLEIFKKYLYFHKKLTFIRTRFMQNQQLWGHFGVKVLAKNSDVL